MQRLEINLHLTGLEVRSQSCDHFFTSFALGTVTSREVGFIKPTLAQIVALTLGYPKSWVETSVTTMPRVSGSIPQGVSSDQISLEVVSTSKPLADARYSSCGQARRDRQLCSKFFRIFTYSYVGYLPFLCILCCARRYEYDLVSYLPLVLLNVQSLFIYCCSRHLLYI